MRWKPSAAAGMALSLLLSGCASSISGNARLTSDAGTFSSKKEILAQWGGPMSIRTDEQGRELWAYEAGLKKGGGVGIAYLILTLSVESQTRVTDKVIFTIAPDGRIVDRKIEPHTCRLGYNPWPF